MSGQRGANKALFNADLLVCLGTHLPIPHTTTLYKSYAPKSKKIIVNIDNNELKNLNVDFDLKIQGLLYTMLWTSLSGGYPKILSFIFWNPMESS